MVLRVFEVNELCPSVCDIMNFSPEPTMYIIIATMAFIRWPMI